MPGEGGYEHRIAIRRHGGDVFEDECQALHVI